MSFTIGCSYFLPPANPTGQIETFFVVRICEKNFFQLEVLIERLEIQPSASGIYASLLTGYLYHIATFSMFFLKQILEDTSLFVEPLIPLFRRQPWVSKPQWIPHLCVLSPACNEFPRFTSGATPADLLATSLCLLNVFSCRFFDIGFVCGHNSFDHFVCLR